MPAVSKAQQRFMGMVHAEKEGKLDKSKLDPEFAAKIERIAASIKAKAARDYAETKHKGLPKKKKKKKSMTKKAKVRVIKKIFDRKDFIKKKPSMVDKMNKEIQDNKDKVVKDLVGMEIGRSMIDTGKSVQHYFDINEPLPKDVEEYMSNDLIPPEGDSRGQNKKAEYIMNKIAKNNKDSYPKDIKQTPSPHLVWKPLMRKISPWKDWGHDAVKTKGVGAVIERILPFGNSGRHWPAEDHEVINEVPGTKGVIQRILPGGKTGFRLEKKGSVNKQLAKLTQETFKYYKYVKKESTKMARIKAANARDNSSWPKYVLDKMEKTFKAKKAPVKKVVKAQEPKVGKQMELFSKKADYVFTKIAKKKKRKSKATWKNTAIVAGTGAASTFVPFVPMHVGSAIERAPKGYKGKAAKDTYKWGHIASLPSTLLLAAHALKGGGPVRRLVTFSKSPKLKNWQNFTGSFKRLGKPFRDYVVYGSLAQGLGAGYGYRKGLTPNKPGRKRKKKRRRTKK